MPCRAALMESAMLRSRATDAPRRATKINLIVQDLRRRCAYFGGLRALEDGVHVTRIAAGGTD